MKIPKLYRPNEFGATFPPVDYLCLMNAADGCKNVLEFGPGCSTYALIEAGCERIVSAESIPGWADLKREEFKSYPQVEFIPYQDLWPIALLDAPGPFDLAFVDGPSMVERPIVTKPSILKRVPGGNQRLNTMLAALERSKIVYCHDAFKAYFRGTLGHLNGMGHKVTFCLETSDIGMARVEHG